MNVKRLMAVLLAVAITVTAAGCSGGDKSWVASLGEVRLSAGVYSLNVMTALSEAGYRAEITMEPDNSEVFAADIDGQTGSEFITQYAQDEARRQLATDAKFTAMGLSLTEDEVKQYTDYSKQMYESEPEMFKAMGVSEQSVVEYNRYSIQGSKLFSTIYGTGGEKAATDEEVIKYFGDNYYQCFALPVPKIDLQTGAPLEQAALEAAEAEAKAALEAVNDGSKSMVDLIHENAEAQMPEGSEPLERDKDSNYMLVVDKVNSGTYPVVLTDYLGSAAVGKTELIEDEQFFIVVQKLDETKADVDVSSYYYNSMLPQLKGEEYLELCKTWAEEFEITFNEAAVKHYTGEKIKKDTDTYIKKMQASMSSSQEAQAPSLSAPEVSGSSESSASSDAGASSSAE